MPNGDRHKAGHVVRCRAGDVLAAAALHLESERVRLRAQPKPPRKPVRRNLGPDYGRSGDPVEYISVTPAAESEVAVLLQRPVPPGNRIGEVGRVVVAADDPICRIERAARGRASEDRRRTIARAQPMQLVGVGSPVDHLDLARPRGLDPVRDRGSGLGEACGHRLLRCEEPAVRCVARLVVKSAQTLDVDELVEHAIHSRRDRAAACRRKRVHRIGSRMHRVDDPRRAGLDEVSVERRVVPGRVTRRCDDFRDAVSREGDLRQRVRGNIEQQAAVARHIGVAEEHDLSAQGIDRARAVVRGIPVLRPHRALRPCTSRRVATVDRRVAGEVDRAVARIDTDRPRVARGGCIRVSAVRAPVVRAQIERHALGVRVVAVPPLRPVHDADQFVADGVQRVVQVRRGRPTVGVVRDVQADLSGRRRLAQDHPRGRRRAQVELVRLVAGIVCMAAHAGDIDRRAFRGEAVPCVEAAVVRAARVRGWRHARERRRARKLCPLPSSKGVAPRRSCRAVIDFDCSSKSS